MKSEDLILIKDVNHESQMFCIIFGFFKIHLAVFLKGIEKMFPDRGFSETYGEGRNISK